MTRLKRHLEKLGRIQTEHPWYFLLSALIVTVVAGVLAAGLKFDSSYEALLPKNAPEVKNADTVREKTGGTRQIVLAISGKDPDARIAFGRKILNKIKNLDNITAVNLEFDMQFFEDRGLWLMDAETLDALIPALEEAVKIAKWQANPMHLHLDEEDEKEELEAAWKKVDDVIDIKRSKLPFDNVLTSEDGKYTFMLVTPSIKFSDMKAGKELLEAIHTEIDALNPKKHGVSVRSAGNLDMVQEQHKTMRTDLRNASILALILGIIIVATFTRKPIAPLVIGVPLLAGVAWTFAITRLLVGHVNIITGFLVAVLIGLGIDFGVHLFVRYQQEMEIKGLPPKEAIIRAVAGTLAPALISALTTAGTFFSFAIADFRGFSEFGLIAGVGVILTLASSFLILPPLVVVTQRRKKQAAPTFNLSAGALPGTLNTKATVALIMVMGLSTLYGLFHIGDIPFRNNFRLLRGYSEATEFLDYVDENLGVGVNPAVFLTATTENATKIEALVREQKESGQVGGKPTRIGSHFSIGDLLPKHPDELRPRIEKLRKILDDPKLDRAEKKEGERAEQLTQSRKMVKTEPWHLDDIPDVFRRFLSTKDGAEQIVFAWPRERNDSDYQATAWEEELEILSTKIDDEKIAHSKADETLIIAWIYRLIKEDSLPLLTIAAIVVLILLALDFRNFRDTLLVAFPLLVGMGMLACVLYVWRLELNMFNLIVVPSLIGIGIDNAVHIYHRYKEEGPGSLTMVVRTTGMAALLASLTTAVGFGSSLISHHLGLKSLGTLAVIGIGATFLASTVFFPCVLSLLEKRKQK
jgi:hypothetical protein